MIDLYTGISLRTLKGEKTALIKQFFLLNYLSDSFGFHLKLFVTVHCFKAAVTNFLIIWGIFGAQ